MSKAKTAQKQSKDGKFVIDPTVERIISLNDGKHAYVLDTREPKTHHLATDTDEFVTLVKDLGVAETVRDLATRHPDSEWPIVLDRFVA
jgi:hypothetical protein